MRGREGEKGREGESEREGESDRERERGDTFTFLSFFAFVLAYLLDAEL